MKMKQTYEDVLREVRGPVTPAEFAGVARDLSRKRENRQKVIAPAVSARKVSIPPSLEPMTPKAKFNDDETARAFGPKLAQRRARRHAMKAKREQGNR